ncbi:PREDICTED: strictosidine synthase-like [Fragaria vesca subsp. vesca]
MASSISQAEGLSLGGFEHHEIPVPVVGPESVAFDCSGAVYAGVADGRIFKWLGSQYGWSEFATTSPSRPRGLCDGSTNKDNEPICGRPLGLRFDLKTCELYIADAYFGLLKTGPNGGVAQTLATEVNGTPFRFTNDVDINPQTGMVYFTDSSTIYQRRQ